MIDWTKYFDAIYLLHYAGYNGVRYTQTMDELKRVGILDSGIFHEYESIQSPFYLKLCKQIPHDPRMDGNPSLFSCTFGHYSICKICELKNYDRVLILEDDIVFLNDLEKIESILDKTPDNMDLVMYTHFVGIFDRQSVSQYISQMRYAKENNIPFTPIGNIGPDIASCGMYSVSRNFATIICGLQERYFSVSDVIINHPTSRYKCDFPEFTDNILGNTRRCYCSTPLALQKYYRESMTESNKKELTDLIIRQAVVMYRNCGLDLGEYNKFDEFIKDLM